MNTVIVIGNLTRDVELKHTPNNQAVAKMGIAINESYTNKQGEKVRNVTYLNVTAWRKQAEICAEHLAKGSKVGIRGKIKVNEWRTKEGDDRKDVYIQADEVEFLSPSPKDVQASGQGDGPADDDHLPF